MKQEKEQTQVLLWTATLSLFLFVVFRLKIFENIEQIPYLPWIAVFLLSAQLINHEQAAISLRKKSPNFTNYFYPENGRMILGNMIASAIVLEFNVFNYNHSHFNFSLELISIPFLIAAIFLVENSQGGFLAFKRIYFPKKWDQLFKAYGVDVLSVLLMIAMWIPVILRVPLSALLWIFMSTLLLKGSVIYTNKYNHVGWCFLLEALLVLQLLTLGFQGNQIWFLGLGIIAGIAFLTIYISKIDGARGFVIFATLLFTIGIMGLYYFYHGKNSIVFYLQREIALLAGIFLITKIWMIACQKWKKKVVNKYSYDGAVEEKTTVLSQTVQVVEPKNISHKKTILLKKADSVTEKTKVKVKTSPKKRKPLGKTFEKKQSQEQPGSLQKDKYLPVMDKKSEPSFLRVEEKAESKADLSQQVDKTEKSGNGKTNNFNQQRKKENQANTKAKTNKQEKSVNTGNKENPKEKINQTKNQEKTGRTAKKVGKQNSKTNRSMAKKPQPKPQLPKKEGPKKLVSNPPIKKAEELIPKIKNIKKQNKNIHLKTPNIKKQSVKKENPQPVINKPQKGKAQPLPKAVSAKAEAIKPAKKAVKPKTKMAVPQVNPLPKKKPKYFKKNKGKKLVK
ncbi:hypothetical protein EII17_11220 [Clostridiales bacterium COT073_COT-073]|nr:hypothetical protein EII17_11220 [Clostridiales bacterium COT073_COT-073]